MSVSARVSAAAVAGILTAAVVVLAPPAGAAPAPPGPAGPAAAGPGSPGKGDADGDRIADDLAAALVDAAPGDRLDVIVQGTSPRSVRPAAPSLVPDHVYSLITGFSGSVVAGQVRALSRVPGVTRVELDGTARALDASGDLDYGVTAARATNATSDGSVDGSGVGICVIDTGVDPNHEQLAGKVVGWHDWVAGQPQPYDDHGHGTHVSSIAAGLGATHPQYGGVARGASIIGAKVLASNGSGADSDVVAAIDWCAARPDVGVISMSLGSPASDGSDAGSQASDAAVAAGKVVVAAAGNGGDAPSTIASPGVATDVITVGAGSDPSSLAGSQDTDTGLYLAGFSSRGPTTNPAAPIKPDVVAPGLSVVAAQAGTQTGYVAYSGTSMATPFVSGVVALGIEAAPNATPGQLKTALRASAHDAGAPGADPEWGAGLVDARSFLAALGAAPAGTAPWPGHIVLQGSVGNGSSVDLPITVSSAGQPLAVTLRTVNGAASCLLWLGGSCIWGYEWAPDLDLYLIDPSGTQRALSRCMLEATNGNCAAPGRFETASVTSAAAGTWTLRIESFSGSGSYAVDVFGALGQAPPPPPPAPTAPTGLTATATGTTSIGLSWTDTSSTETGFTLQRCSGSGCSSFQTVATLGADATSYSDTGLTAGTPYSYRVRADGAGDPSAWSATASATTDPATTPPPSAPTGLGATATSPGTVELAWTDTSSNETSFTVERCAGSGCTGFATVASTPADTTSYSDTGLTAGTTYTYRVRAEGDGGPSAWSGTASATTDAVAPLATPELSATSVTATRVVLAWTDAGATEGYRVFRCEGNRCSTFTRIADTGPSVLTATDTAVTTSTKYTYYVEAYQGSLVARSADLTVRTPRR